MLPVTMKHTLALNADHCIDCMHHCGFHTVAGMTTMANELSISLYVNARFLQMILRRYYDLQKLSQSVSAALPRYVSIENVLFEIESKIDREKLARTPLTFPPSFEYI